MHLEEARCKDSLTRNRSASFRWFDLALGPAVPSLSPGRRPVILEGARKGPAYPLADTPLNRPSVSLQLGGSKLGSLRRLRKLPQQKLLILAGSAKPHQIARPDGAPGLETLGHEEDLHDPIFRHRIRSSLGRDKERRWNLAGDCQR